MTPQAYIFMGRYGAGKGTQAALLIERLKQADTQHAVIYIETGKEFRIFNEGSSYTATQGKKIVDSGRLMPEYMCVYLWGRRIIEEYTGNEHLVFDGSPRKLMEAKMLEDIFIFYGLDKPWVIYLDVDHDESHKRLSLRGKTSGRVDDHPSAMDARRAAYEADIVPSIEYYRTSPRVKFLDIKGEQSIEAVHADIVKATGLA